MGFGLIIAGLAFFFLPNISIVDITPDFIGCLLIIIGLNKLYDLSPKLEDARKAFFRAFILTLVKTLALLTIPFFSKNDGGMFLVYSFSFAVLDFIYIIPAFIKLINGILYLGDRTNSASVFKSQKEFETMTYVFLISRDVLALIPDFSYISNPDVSGNVTAIDPLYISNYKNLLLVLNIVITTVLGVVWFAMGVKYFKGIMKDSKLIDTLKKQYEEKVLSNKNLLIKRRLTLSLIIFAVSAFFFIDIYFDYINFIPDFISGLLFIIASLLLKKYIDTKYLTISACVFTLTSVLFWVVSFLYAQKYPDVFIWTNMEAYSAFAKVNICHIAETVPLIIFIYLLYRTLKKIISVHTGAMENELPTMIIKKEREKKSMYIMNKITMFFGLAVCAASIARVILMYDMPTFKFVDYALTVAWICLIVKTINMINYAIDTKYM